MATALALSQADELRSVLRSMTAKGCPSSSTVSASFSAIRRVGIAPVIEQSCKCLGDAQPIPAYMPDRVRRSETSVVVILRFRLAQSSNTC